MTPSERIVYALKTLEAEMAMGFSKSRTKAIEELIDAKLAEQSSHAAKGEREGDGDGATPTVDELIRWYCAGSLLVGSYDPHGLVHLAGNVLEWERRRAKAEQHGGGMARYAMSAACVCGQTWGAHAAAKPHGIPGECDAFALDEPSKSPAPDGDGGEDPSVTAEYSRCGPVSHEEAEDIAQRYIDCAFNNRDKPRPLHCIPANPKTDSDIRLTAYIRQQKQREKDSAEALGRAEARLAAWEPVVRAAIAWTMDGAESRRLVTTVDALPAEHRPEKTGGEG